MRNAADYFGLMAYLWVMSGGMPESDLLPAQERNVARHKSKARTRRRLRVIEGGRAHEPITAAPAADVADTGEGMAAA